MNGLEFLQSVSADELAGQIEALGEVKIVSIYAVGCIHFAWVLLPKQVKGDFKNGSGKK